MLLNDLFGDQAYKIPSQTMLDADGKIKGYYYDLENVEKIVPPKKQYFPLKIYKRLIVNETLTLEQGDNIYFDINKSIKPKQGDFVVLLVENENPKDPLFDGKGDKYKEFYFEPVIYCDEMIKNTDIKGIYQVKRIEKGL